MLSDVGKRAFGDGQRDQSVGAGRGRNDPHRERLRIGGVAGDCQHVVVDRDVYQRGEPRDVVAQQAVLVRASGDGLSAILPCDVGRMSDAGRVERCGAVQPATGDPAGQACCRASARNSDGSRARSFLTGTQTATAWPATRVIAPPSTRNSYGKACGVPDSGCNNNLVPRVRAESNTVWPHRLRGKACVTCGDE